MKKILIMLIIFVLSAQTALAENEDYIARAYSDGVIFGDETGNFDGGKQASRAEFAAMAERFFGLSGGVNVFEDVSDSDWFSQSIAAAAANRMLFGYEDGKVHPYEPITCEDTVTIIGRYYEAYANPDGLENVVPYARKYYAYALENALFTGWKLNNPQHCVTKGEIIELLYKYKENDEKRIHFTGAGPRIAEKGVFNNLSIELETSMPCTVYYGISDAGGTEAETDTVLCAVPASDTAVTANIVVNMSKRYDIYLKAVTNNGVSRTAVIKGAAPFTFSSGSGTAENPYVIYSRSQLEQICDYPDKAYILGNDIDAGRMSAIAEFSGTLDGNGCRIYGLEIESNDENIGLFGTLRGGTVKNLTVDAQISAKKNVGIIAGINDGGTIKECVVTGNVSAKTSNSGGICGLNYGTVSDCLSAVTEVTAGAYAGGIAGQNYESISSCLTACQSITTDMYAGGVAGTNNGGKISGCAAINMTVYNSMTKNGGRIAANREDGITVDNYAFERTDSNAAAEIESRYSQNGINTPWESFTDIEFYRKIGWSKNKWKQADNGFRLVYPKACAQPELAMGESVYFPKVINDADGLYELGKNSGGHYILGNNIYMKLPWKTVCGLVGFSGTLDGNGYTIYGLELNGESGFFSNISGGTVRNLNLRNVSANPSENGAVIAACNYGFIENCTVEGVMKTQKAGSVGIIAGQNNGQIINCSVTCDITQSSDNSIAGGICSDNSGVITGCSYSGRIDVSGENSVAGGISGCDAGGYIIESFSDAQINIKKSDSYIGGICGISSGTQFYKCSFNGSINAEGSYSSSGGICGTAESSVVYNCFSAGKYNVTAEKAYAAGICGYASGTNIQNTYSCAYVSADGQDSFAGGICGYSEQGFIMQNVSLCPRINSAAAGGIAGASEESELSDNYSCERIRINSEKITESENNGILRSLSALKNINFYCNPLETGGLLGWSGGTDDDSIWSVQHRGKYPFPTLTGTPGQSTFAAPSYAE